MEGFSLDWPSEAVLGRAVRKAEGIYIQGISGLNVKSIMLFKQEVRGTK